MAWDERSASLLEQVRQEFAEAARWRRIGRDAFKPKTVVEARPTPLAEIGGGRRRIVELRWPSEVETRNPPPVESF